MSRPRIAILREQGVNSHVETAYVMHKSGFTAVDVHMSDLISGRARLDDFKGFGVGMVKDPVEGIDRPGWNIEVIEHLLPLCRRTQRGCRPAPVDCHSVCLRRT